MDSDRCSFAIAEVKKRKADSTVYANNVSLFSSQLTHGIMTAVRACK